MGRISPQPKREGDGRRRTHRRVGLQRDWTGLCLESSGEKTARAAKPKWERPREVCESPKGLAGGQGCLGLGGAWNGRREEA